MQESKQLFAILYIVYKQYFKHYDLLQEFLNSFLVLTVYTERSISYFAKKTLPRFPPVQGMQ